MVFLLQVFFYLRAESQPVIICDRGDAMIDARRRGGPGGGGAVVNGDYFDVDMAPSSSAAVRDAPEKSKQLHSDKTMERMQTAFLVIAILFAVGMASWMIAATLYHQKHPRPHHSPGHHTIRKSFHIKVHSDFFARDPALAATRLYTCVELHHPVDASW